MEGSASLDRAVFTAFAGDFEALLDHMTVSTMNFARDVDGTTPLMAACARGNRPVVELLLDLGCQPMAKDTRGWTALEHAAASPVQEDLGKLILERVLPPTDASGKPVHTWDTCSHPAENRYLDESLGWLICTNCALVLDEKALVMAGEPTGGSKNGWAVRGAEQEYNAWRHDEMDIADAMRALGIVDNEGAKRRGLDSSIWKQREKALEWLDRRRRIILSWRDKARIAQNAGMPLPAKPLIPMYPEALEGMCAPSMRRSQRNQRLLNPEPLRHPVFKGSTMQQETDEEEEEEEEEELLDPSAMREAFGDPLVLVAKWRKCLSRWKGMTRCAVRRQRYAHAGKLAAVAEEGEMDEMSSEVQEGVEIKTLQRVEGQMEIEFEYERN